MIELLAATPLRNLTLSQIARTTQINVASCHALLNVLVARGYVARTTSQKAYTLGPVLLALGGAARLSQGLAASAIDAAAQIERELGIPTILTTMVGEEIICIASFANAAGACPDMNVGERLPLVAPMGAPFLAWSSDEEIHQWIDRNSAGDKEKLRQECIHTLGITRDRGFHVTLHSQDGGAIAALISQLASGKGINEYRSEMTTLLKSLDRQFVQPDVIEDDKDYSVAMIASPIFSKDGSSIYNLCLGGFPNRITGVKISEYADRLVRTCLRVMLDGRTG